MPPGTKRGPGRPSNSSGAGGGGAPARKKKDKSEVGTNVLQQHGLAFMSTFLLLAFAPPKQTHFSNLQQSFVFEISLLLALVDAKILLFFQRLSLGPCAVADLLRQRRVRRASTSLLYRASLVLQQVFAPCCQQRRTMLLIFHTKSEF